MSEGRCEWVYRSPKDFPCISLHFSRCADCDLRICKGHARIINYPSWLVDGVIRCPACMKKWQAQIGEYSHAL